MTEKDPLLTNEQAAILLKLAPTYLHNMRYNHRGPAFTKQGQRVYYRRSELLKWNAARLAKQKERKARAAARGTKRAA